MLTIGYLKSLYLKSIFTNRIDCASKVLNLIILLIFWTFMIRHSLICFFLQLKGDIRHLFYKKLRFSPLNVFVLSLK